MLTSLIVAISVPWLAIAPTEMLRSDTQPEKGARITRSPISAPAAWRLRPRRRGGGDLRVIVGRGWRSRAP